MSHRFIFFTFVTILLVEQILSFSPNLIWKDKGCSGDEENPRCWSSTSGSPAFVVDDDGTGYIVTANSYLSLINVNSGEIVWQIRPNDIWNWVPVISIVRNFQAENDIAIVTTHVSSLGTHLCAHNLKGETLPGFCVKVDNGACRSLSIGRIAKDENYRIIIGKFDSISVYDNWGNFEWTKGTNIAWIGADNIGLADLNGDGNLEIIIPSDSNTIAAYNRWGSQIKLDPDVLETHYDAQYWGDYKTFRNPEDEVYGYWRRWLEGEEIIENRLWPCFDCHGITPFEHNGQILLASTAECIYESEWSYQTLMLIQTDRTKYTGWEELPDIKTQMVEEDYSNIHSMVTVVDLNGNGEPEFIFPLWDGHVHLFSMDKTQPGNWPKNLGNRFASESVAFKNPGEDAVVVFCSWNIYDEQTPANNDLGRMHFMDYNGNDVISEISLPPISQRTGEETEKKGWNQVQASPTLFRYANYSKNLMVALTSYQGGSILYELEGTENADILWGTSRGSFLRNGNLELDSSSFPVKPNPMESRTVVAVVVSLLIVFFVGLAFGLVVVFVVIFVVVKKRSSGKASEGEKEMYQS